MDDAIDREVERRLHADPGWRELTRVVHRAEREVAEARDLLERHRGTLRRYVAMYREEQADWIAREIITGAVPAEDSTPSPPRG